MPTRHIVKIYVPGHYYHVFNRGWNLTKIFQDKQDYQYFEQLLQRYISPEQQAEKSGKPYRHLYSSVRLNAYCLMGNHFHLLLYQYDEDGVKILMQSVLTAYTMYFNRKYKRRGPLFESTFKAVIVLENSQLMHITRYIHLNHRDFQSWKHSSYQDYLSSPRKWIDSSGILGLFSNSTDYKLFVEDYESLQREREMIKHELYGKTA